jgi:hypothetical protein
MSTFRPLAFPEEKVWNTSACVLTVSVFAVAGVGCTWSAWITLSAYNGSCRALHYHCTLYRPNG